MENKNNNYRDIPEKIEFDSNFKNLLNQDKNHFKFGKESGTVFNLTISYVDTKPKNQFMSFFHFLVFHLKNDLMLTHVLHLLRILV